MSSDRLRLHRFLPVSRANGPGQRAVIWTQGCTLGCSGCFNPETHTPDAGEWLSIDQLAKMILESAPHLEGVTISGGEPFQQTQPLVNLLRLLNEKSNLSILIFSGYTWEQILKIPGSHDVITLTDVIVAGRYINQQRIATGLLGSNNKTVHFLTTRYTPADLKSVPEAEVILEPNGDVLLSGIHPIQW